MRARLIVLALNSLILLALAGLAAASPKPPTFERVVEGAGPGRLAITLDRDVYEGARADLGDLRVVDDRGREVPYWLDRGEAGAAEHRRPEIRNRGFLRGREATARAYEHLGLKPRGKAAEPQRTLFDE